MTTADVLGIVSLILGLGISVFAIIDNRRLRGEREKAVIAVRGVIDRSYGVLIGLKPLVKSLPGAEAAINDVLSAINQERATLDRL